MANETQKTYGVQEAWAVWNRRKRLAMLVFAAPFTAAVGLTIFLPNIYRSTATILVERQQVPEAFVRNTVTGELETRLHTISQEILSRSRLEGLIARFGLYPDLRKDGSAEAVIERMRSDIQLDLKGAGPRARGGETIAFTISYRGNNPQTVATLTNTLASFYIEENLKVRERQAAGTAEFLRIELQEVKQRLDEQERLVSEFKKRYIGELPQQMQANLATLEGLNAQLRLNSDSQMRTMERREATAKQLAEAGSFGPAGGPDATAARLARLKQELTELRDLFSDKYPDVIRVKTQIAVLERQLAEARANRRPEENESASAASPYILQLRQALSDLDAEIKVLKADERRLRAGIASYQRRVEETPRREQEFQALSRDYETTSQLYRSLVTRHEEAQIAEKMEQRQKGEQFRILDPAIASQQPAAPNRLRLILIGLMISLGLAAGTVMLTEHLDNSFHTLDDLRAFTTVSVLASIPRIVTKADAGRRRWRFRLVAAAAMLGLALIFSSSYLLAQGYVPLVGPFVRSLLLRT
jgi:polysaccharide chain length determinant protein (PEP-CTERM system associated)